MISDNELRAEFERQHKGRNLLRHRMRGTYSSATIAALWNQHKHTAEWCLERGAAEATSASVPRVGGNTNNDDSNLAAAGVAVSDAVAEQAEPVEYQYRTRADWHKGWSEWDRCTKEQAADYIATPLLHDWHHEVRALVVAAAGSPAILSDTDENAPWLTLAHIICADAGIPVGHINDRLKALRDKLGQVPAILPQGDATPTKEQLNEAISEYVRAAEDTMAAQPTNDAGKRWEEARAALDTVIDALFPGAKP